MSAPQILLERQESTPKEPIFLRINFAVTNNQAAHLTQGFMVHGSLGQAMNYELSTMNILSRLKRVAVGLIYLQQLHSWDVSLGLIS